MTTIFVTVGWPALWPRYEEAPASLNLVGAFRGRFVSGYRPLYGDHPPLGNYLDLCACRMGRLVLPVRIPSTLFGSGQRSLALDRRLLLG